MAGQNGSTPEWQLDLDAFAPKPAGRITLKDGKGKATEYAVWSVLDLKSKDAVAVLALENEIATPGKTFQEQLDLGLKQIRLLCPDLPSTVDLTPGQMLTVRRKALGYDAANPQTAEAAVTAPSAHSSASLPVPDVTSTGPRANSTS